MISPISHDRRILHRESFLSSQSIYDNKYHSGTPTSVTFGATRGLNYGIFNGTNKIDLGSQFVGKSRSYSVSFWINKSSNSGRVIDQLGGTGYITSATQDITLSQNSSQSISTSGSKVPNNTWVHVVCTATNAEPCIGTIYINGVLQVTGSIGTTRTLGTNILIGNVSAVNNGMVGNLADLAIWDGVLTSQEASLLYKNRMYKDIDKSLSQTLGNDLLAGWDFTSGWSANSATIDSANTFHAAAVGNIQKGSLLTVGSRYKMTIVGTNGGVANQTVSGTSSIAASYIVSPYLNSSPFNSTFTFTATSINLVLYLNAGTTTITSMTLQPITQEGGSVTFDINAAQGVIRDSTGLRTITNTSTTVAKYGSANIMSFNGGNSKLDLGADFIGTSDYSFFGWFFIKSDGSSTVGRLIDNGKLLAFTHLGVLQVKSDGAAGPGQASSGGGLRFGKIYHLGFTRTSVGTTNVFVNGVLSGTANQSSGTPAAGTTNVLIGLDGGGSGFVFDGLIYRARGWNRILTTEEIIQMFDSQRNLFGV